MIRTVIVAAALALAPGMAAQTAEMAFYQLPAGAYPHDVAPAPDGTVWFSGQTQGFAGRFDPKSGQLEKIPLGPGAAPHGVIVGPDGNAWLTEGGQNAIARVDAKTKDVKLFPLPKEFPGVNLNTLAFDNKGKVWFTGYAGIYGRADPATGKVEVRKAPKGAGPYGMTGTPGGDVWYASLAGDHIARIDTASGEATVVDPPRKGVGPRRIWSDSKGVLWVSFWNAGAIGRYDPAGRRRTGPERNFLELSALGIEAAGKSLALAAEPHRAVRRRRDVVRIGAGGKLVERHLGGLGGHARRERQRRGSDHGADHDVSSPVRWRLRADHSAASRPPPGRVQRSAKASSEDLASTQVLRSAYSTCFQNGARVLR